MRGKIVLGGKFILALRVNILNEKAFFFTAHLVRKGPENTVVFLV